MKKKSKLLLLMVPVITILWISWLIGIPCPRVAIEQDIDINSIINNTYNVKTYVWIYHGSLDLEKVFHACGIKCEDIPIEGAKQREEAEKVANQVREALRTFTKCKYM